MIITDFLEKNAKLSPDKVSLVEINPSDALDSALTWQEYSLIQSTCSTRYRREMTWQEFDRKANRFANFLLSRGLKRGEKVAVLMMNCLEWLPIYFGALKAGMVVVPLNFRYTSEEIEYCLQLSESCSLIFGPEFIDRVEKTCQENKNLRLKLFVGSNPPAFAESYEQLIQYCSSWPPAIDIDEDDDAAIYFSSGTTGFPKAILHGHKALMTACLVEQKHHQQTKDDVFLCIPPLYHTGAKMHWFGSLMTGSKAVILRGVRPEWILRAAAEEHATIVWLLVPWAQDILDAIESGNIDLGSYHLETWRLMHIGAQPVPPSLIRRWKEYFPHHDYDTNYGLSESIGPGCVHLGMGNIHKVGAIGKAGYLWETKIVDEYGVPVKPGSIGELCVKGPGLMKCYYNNPTSTQEILKGDWLLTGDMAKEDEDGFIFLVDRKKDVIITGGENLYPVQIEDFLRTHPAIKDVAVIGLPDPRLGEIAAAIIELKPGQSCTEEAIDEFCLELPRYKRPKRILFDHVPRNPTGKIEKPALRERYGALRLVEKETTVN